MSRVFDVIIIGAGSAGLPTALALTKKGFSTLVIDALSSPGQANNKKAIGGIRATHSDFGKIQICKRSLEIFSSWQECYGDDIGWLQNGYSYPAYTENDEIKLKSLMHIQEKFGLNIVWISPEEYNELVPGINMKNLRGSTYSQGDGSASPLLAANAFYFKSLDFGCEYAFNEVVVEIESNGTKEMTVITNKSKYVGHFVINAAGNSGQKIAKLVNQDLPLVSDNHEGAITEPVQRFFQPMIVDMRPAEDSMNYYFYQNKEGQVIFCITPDPPCVGIDNDSTSWFFPKIAQRMIELFPKLSKLRVRRAWRGQYPNTPDGFPIVGRSKNCPQFINCAGLCGQGFMLGPGLGELMARIVADDPNQEDEKILKGFDLDRDFSGMEAFK